ncbi:hypothetical protein PMAYCL1PPCAC_30074, partial [Pristionchus mayeri]
RYSSQTPCSAPCPSPCGGCPPSPPPPVCPQYPPCPAPAAYPQSYSVAPQYVQPQQMQVVYLDHLSDAKAGEPERVEPQVVYQSLPSGGSRLIVPQGADVYALNAGNGASYQYEQPTVVYRTANLPASGGYAAVEQNVDEMDLKGLEAGIPLRPTIQKRTTLEEIEKIVDELDAMDEQKLVRKVRSLMGDDVISREDKEEERRDYGELISSDEEVEMIGEEKKRKEKKREEKEEEEKKKSKKHHEKNKKSRRSSKKAKADESEEAVNVERD